MRHWEFLKLFCQSRWTASTPWLQSKRLWNSQYIVSCIAKPSASFVLFHLSGFVCFYLGPASPKLARRGRERATASVDASQISHGFTRSWCDTRYADRHCHGRTIGKRGLGARIVDHNSTLWSRWHFVRSGHDTWVRREPSSLMIDTVRGLVRRSQAVGSTSAIFSCPRSQAIEASRGGSSRMSVMPFR